MYEHFHWMYEQIHFDPKPIDIAILGLSRTKVSLSAAAVVRRLALYGKQANVANFSLEGPGRDVQLAILDESSTKRNHAKSRTDFTTSFIQLGKLVDMEHPAPRATLLAQPQTPVPRTFVARALTQINGGEDHLYIRKIAGEAKAHGAQLIFVFIPKFNGSESVNDLDFLKQFGPVLNYGDLTQRDELYENGSHLNHAGAMTARPGTRTRSPVATLTPDQQARTEMIRVVAVIVAKQTRLSFSQQTRLH
jgi:hypothetical protein